MRARHIHFHITEHVDRRATQIFFGGEALNAQDRIFQQIPRNREGLVVDLLPAPSVDTILRQVQDARNEIEAYCTTFPHVREMKLVAIMSARVENASD